jgi:potassium-dependent mechanosensitive channel
MRFSARLAWSSLAGLALLFAAAVAFAQPTAPQRPFSQLIDLWTRQLDRIATRADQSSLLPAEIDTLREQTSEVRSAAMAATAFSRNDLADTKKLLAPLEIKPGPDAPPESDAVKAERQRMTEQATASEGRVKQGEVVIARADQLLERLTKRRSEVVLQTLLHRDAAPLSREVLTRLGPELAASMQSLSSALATWSGNGIGALGSDGHSLVWLTIWAAITIGLWWIGRELRRRFGHSHDREPGHSDRTIAVAIDGLGLVLVPILSVWLIGKLLSASQPPSPIDMLVPEFVSRVVMLLLVFGMTSAALSPTRPEWRVLPFTDDAAHRLSYSIRRLMVIGLTLDFIYVAFVHSGVGREAVAAVSALVLATIVALLTLPALGNRAWQAARPEGSGLPRMVGGTWWSIARLLLSAAVLSSIGFALAGYATLASHLNGALSETLLLIGVALLLHRLGSDLLETVAAPETPSGRWVRNRLSLPPDSTVRGQYLVLLLIDTILVLLLAVAIPSAWDVDMDAILQGFGQLMHGVKVGGVTISLGNIGTAILAFAVCMLIARLVRSIVRDRVMPTVDAPLPLRQSVDAGLNYAGVLIAILVGVGALGVDFTNLAIVLGALSVGIGLGLQNIANNVISGVILLMERPIKAGDWVVVNGHEGFVRRINIRATEIETFQRTSVIVPNSMFLQSPVINRTYSDTSSRVEIQITAPLSTDVAKLEAILREAALGNPRVLRVPAPIVRFVRVGTSGLDFELFVFVTNLEDRLTVANGLNRALLARLIEEKIIDPKPVPELRLRDIDKLGAAFRGEQPSRPPTKEGSSEMGTEGTDDAAAAPKD